jgi:pimeloyl-ACP methyl ester carboxylesterase
MTSRPDGIVLVHGGMHGAWCWELVQPLLDLPSVAVDLPGRGRRPLDAEPVTLDRCVAAVLDDADVAGFDRFVLVGHSMGGLTVTAVAAHAPDRITSLVYVAALTPPVRMSTYRLFFGDDAPAVDDPAGVQPLASPEAARALFAGDLDDVAFDAMYERCVPEPVGLFLATVPHYDSGLPAITVRCTRDGAVPEALATMLAAQLTPARHYELDADHDVMLSQPAALAAILDEAGRLA